MEIKLYFNPKSKRYYHQGHLDCSDCGDEISNIFRFAQSFNRYGKGELRFLCPGCLQKPRLNMFIESGFYVIVCEGIPAGSFPYFYTPPTMSPAREGMSLFEAAYLKSIKTVDNTTLADRENWDGATIGKSEYYKLVHDGNTADIDTLKLPLHKQNREDVRLVFDEEDAKNLLEDLRSAEPALPHFDVKRIEHK